jgi:ribosomal protein S12 methylthiotransferase accessory factor YcaO
MEIYFRPMSYQNMSDNNKLQYENQKMLQNIPDGTGTDVDKMSALSKALQEVTAMTVKALAQSIAMVKTPTAMVSEPEFIEELLKNCDRKLFNEIRDYIVTNKSQSEMQPIKLTCPECTHEYEQTVTLDMSSFFEPAS